MTSPTKRAAVTITLALVLAGATGIAQPTHTAEAAYERGLTALRERRYGDAILHFEDSHRIAPVSGVLFNLALAYRGAGRNLAAVETFSRYLREEGASVAQDRRAAVERAIGELRVGLGTIECQVTPALSNLTFTVDGRPASCGPDPVMVDPGEHALEASAPGYSHERNIVRLEAGARETFRASLTPVVRPTIVTPTRVEIVQTPHPRTPITPERHPFYTRWWFWTIVGAVVTGAAVAAVYAITSEPARPSLNTLFDVEALRVR